MAFSASTKLHYKLIGKPVSTAHLKADNVAHAPDLSKYMSSIYPVGFKFNPPVSKVTPFPNNARVLSLLELLNLS